MTIETTINRMLTQGGSFARSLAHLYTLADPNNQARIRYAFGSLLESYGHPKPDASDRTDELSPEMTDDELAEWACWAHGELRARMAANVDLKLWHDAAMKRIADLEHENSALRVVTTAPAYDPESLETGEADAVEIGGEA